MAYLSGFHAIEELIRSGRPCGPLLISKAGPRARAIESLAIDRKIPIQRTGQSELNRLVPGNRGIALEIGDGRFSSNELSIENFIADLPEDEDAIVVILDGITDPHNFGAIIRTSDQFGVKLLMHPNSRAARDSETVSRTSAGANAWLPIASVPNLVRAVEQLKAAGFWVYGADIEGQAAHKKDLKGRIALIMGSEGSGIARLLREACDAMVRIPSSGQVDSLNVSVATGVLLYEICRQRGFK